MVQRDILFILGAPRSGTTYINKLIRNYFDYGLCSEGQWVRPLAARAHSYSDLTIEKNLHRMIEDIRKDFMFENFRTVYSETFNRPLDVTSADICKNLPERSCAGVVYSVFFSVAEQLGKSRVGNKCPDYWMVLPTLLEWFPSARFLYVVRDGRDVALSIFRRVWGEKTALGSARSWVKCQETTSQFKSDLPPNQFLTIKYEDLLQYPSKTIMSLEEFLGMPLNSDIREKLLAEMDGNDMQHNFGKWRMGMSTRNQRIYEAVAGDWLRRLGYETVFEKPTISWVDESWSFGREFYRKAKVKILSLPLKYPLR